MKPNSTILKLRRISNCGVCGTHYPQSRKTHTLCLHCYHGIKHANAIYAAVKELRLSNKRGYSMESKL